MELDEIIKGIYDSPERLGVAVGFEDLGELHGGWIREMVFGDEDYTLMAHRGSYKSSCLAVAIALMMLFYPTKNIIFLRKTDTDVTEMIVMVTKILESELMDDLCVAIYGKHLSLVTKTSDYVSTNLWTSPMGAPQLLGLGIKVSITGKHADIVITDDICNLTDRISRAERERTKIQYQELQNIKNRGGRIINLGTKWHQEDVFENMPNIHRYDCYQTGLISEETLQQLRESMTPSLFSCNYELRIIPSDDVIFINPQTGGDPSKVEQGECHIDAAYGGEDFTAFSICNYEDGKYYIFGKLWHKHVDDVEDDIIRYQEQFNAGRIRCEDNGDKGYLVKDLRKRGVWAVAYHENMNKALKITTYLKSVWKDVIFVAGTDAEYINQICDWTVDADHDDAADSAASVVRVLWKNT